jgi:hypothetical protein
MATADEKCCRPSHPQLHTARECNARRSTATTPLRVQPSDGRTTGSAKHLAMSTDTRPPYGSSELLVCQRVLDRMHGGEPNRLFPVLGENSQIRDGCIMYYTCVSWVIRVASTPERRMRANCPNGGHDHSARREASKRTKTTQCPDHSLPVREWAFSVRHFTVNDEMKMYVVRTPQRSAKIENFAVALTRRRAAGSASGLSDRCPSNAHPRKNLIELGPTHL